MFNLANCPLGYEEYNNGKCLKFVNNHVTFDTALANCVAENAHLVEPTDSDFTSEVGIHSGESSAAPKFLNWTIGPLFIYFGAVTVPINVVKH